MFRIISILLYFAGFLFWSNRPNSFHNEFEPSDLIDMTDRSSHQFHLRRQAQKKMQNDIAMLCYHHIKKEVAAGNAYTISEKLFQEQMQTLADSGYHTILPDQLLAYNSSGRQLPAKSIIISFDDSNLDQYEYAYPILKKMGFKAIFFIMTVTIGKQNYMSKTQIKELSDKGNVIGCHTWDHPDVRWLKEEDWLCELDIPIKDLEKIVGKPIEYFAYPYGAWNTTAIQQLKKRNIKAAFQLTDKDGTQDYPFAIRRLMVPGTWTGAKLLQNMNRMFKHAGKLGIAR